MPLSNPVRWVQPFEDLFGNLVFHSEPRIEGRGSQRLDSVEHVVLEQHVGQGCKRRVVQLPQFLDVLADNEGQHTCAVRGTDGTLTDRQHRAELGELIPLLGGQDVRGLLAEDPRIVLRPHQFPELLQQLVDVLFGAVELHLRLVSGELVDPLLRPEELDDRRLLHEVELLRVLRPAVTQLEGRVDRGVFHA